MAQTTTRHVAPPRLGSAPLLALPGARIYAFGADAVRETADAELEHVRVTRDFLNAPERDLRRLA